ncbi:Polyamine aminopropyltransferase [Bacillus rhizoplanae]|uniref:Polyamine aminopropyltransferase n=1 Tax=Bacillus rhizoplanae TaxID=2880966 RepID=A0ABN7ZT92_9BACI|nr:spermidine synthase [Bacillus rhizoplanae]CAG9612172.1 Polyamine aminopropyltransferase [Bacillus rhizoplanae]
MPRNCRKHDQKEESTADCKKYYNKKSNSNNSNSTSSQSYSHGDIWDKLSLGEILADKHTALFRGKSQYQKIDVLKVNDVRMYLDEQLQFSSVDERLYHEALVHPAMALVDSPKSVLILGGGDGLALREVLKYQTVRRVDLVDLDEEVIKVATNVPEIVALNEGAFFDKRVNIHAYDARKFLRTKSRKYDVIIIDFPDPATETLSQLYTKELFSVVSSFLTKGGAFVCQSNSPEDAPLTYWSIGRTIRSTGLTVASYHTIVPSFGNDWGFHIATNSSSIMRNRNPLPVTVPHRTLPKNLALLFRFREDLLEERQNAVINTENQLILHRCYQEDMEY